MENTTFIAKLTYPTDLAEAFADRRGYQPMVVIPEAELPAKVDVVVPDPVTGEDITVQEYPEGTELYKANPETREEFLKKWFKEEFAKLFTIDAGPEVDKYLASQKAILIEKEKDKIRASLTVDSEVTEVKE